MSPERVTKFPVGKFPDASHGDEIRAANAGSLSVHKGLDRRTGSRHPEKSGTKEVARSLSTSYAKMALLPVPK